MEFDPRDYAAEFEHAKANLATRTAEAHSAQVTVPIVDASVFGQLHSARSSTPEPLGWIEEQFRAAGHEKDSRELAVHLFCAFQGMSAVAHGANAPDLIVMEVRRLKDWIRAVL